MQIDEDGCIVFNATVDSAGAMQRTEVRVMDLGGEQHVVLSQFNADFVDAVVVSREQLLAVYNLLRAH